MERSRDNAGSAFFIASMMQIQLFCQCSRQQRALFRQFRIPLSGIHFIQDAVKIKDTGFRP
jgi:hypothetical protein